MSVQVQVEIGQAVAELENLTKQITGRQLYIATSRAMNKTLQQGRTEARKAVKQHYNIPQSQLKLINIKPASPSKLSGYIYASGKPITVSSFKAKFSTPTKRLRITKKGVQRVKELKRRNNNPGKGVYFSLRPGETLNIPYAFQISGKAQVFAKGYYADGVGKFTVRNKREQKAGSDIHINALMSVTIYQAVINDDVFEKLKNKVEGVFPGIMKHELEYIISKMPKAST
jgi:hypothetical protein